MKGGKKDRMNELAYKVGALLYSPAINLALADKIEQGQLGKLTSMAFCLEDSIQDSALEQAEQTLKQTLKRFCKIVRVEKIICAGDSAIDIPMLSRADISIVPNKYLEQRINGENTIVADSNSVFSEFILKTALANIG